MDGPKPIKMAYITAHPKAPEEDRPSVVLIHGLAQTKERWKDTMQILADDSGRTVYAVDMRNHGDSEQGETFDFDALTNDLEYFLECHKLSRVAIVGHSLGAVVAMNLALKSESKVEGVVLEEMSPIKFVPELGMILAEMLREQYECLKLLPPNSQEDFVHRMLKECVYRTIPMIPDEDREVLEKMRFPIRKTESGYEYRANLPIIWKALENQDSLLQNHDGNFQGKALFIFGGSSTMRISEDEDVCKNLFPKAEFICVPEAGHEVYKYNPREFVFKLTEFLNAI